MTTKQSLDDVLEHYGIKGMKWGVRRTREQIDRARAKRREKGKPVTPVSEDAQRAHVSRQKAKEGGVSTLSNQELQQLNKRLNLEQDYKRLTTEPKGKKKGVTDADKKLIAAVIQTAGKAYMSNAKQNPAAKAVGTALVLRDK